MISKMLKKDKKGFTLMEMLIVVAIIAVLIAIAIPTFTAALNKSRVATDSANIRSGYASAVAEVLASDNEYTADNANNNEFTFTLNKDGSVAGGLTGATEDAYATLGNNEGKDTMIAGLTIAGGWDKGEGVTYTYNVSTDAWTITVG